MIVDEHVEPLDRRRRARTSCVIQVYITNAYRAYRIADHYRARGAFVALGGLHVTSLPDEAAPHADAIFLGPGEQTFPQFLRRLPRRPARARSTARPSGRTLERAAADPPRSDRAPPLPRAQLDRRHARLPAALRLLLQGRVLRAAADRFYTQRVDDALAEIDAAARPPSLLPRRSSARRSPLRRARCSTACAAWAACSRAPRRSIPILRGDLIERAAEAGLRSLFVGFETLTPGNLRAQQQASESRPRLLRGHRPPARPRHHDQRQLRVRHGRRRRGRVSADGGLGDRARHHDGDLPHPDAVSRARGCSRAWPAQGRIITRDWDLYDTRHVVFRPARLTPQTLESTATTGPTASSTAGRRSRARRCRTARSSTRRSTSSTPPAGRSSSRSGISMIRAQAAAVHDAAARRRAVEGVRGRPGWFHICNAESHFGTLAPIDNRQQLITLRSSLEKTVRP